ncbi:1270_t:CDS:2, partial [Ambispora leptoticha]
VMNVEEVLDLDISIPTQPLLPESPDPSSNATTEPYYHNCSTNTLTDLLLTDSSLVSEPPTTVNTNH